jgi:phosphoadenosine phosphosulfate reductase
MGVRKAESVARMKRYDEPTKCLTYGSKKNYVEAFYPILEWSDQDVADFIKERGIECHPLYYDEQGNFHVERRLGCLCCPLVYRKKRVEEFKKYPRMIVLYLRAGQKFRDTHPDAAFTKNYDNIYDAFVRTLFYDTDNDFKQSRNGLFEPIDCKTFLERYFNINLDPSPMTP